MTRPIERLVAELSRVLDEHVPDCSASDLALNYDDGAIADVVEVARGVHRIRMALAELGVPAPDVLHHPSALFTPGLPLPS